MSFLSSSWKESPGNGSSILVAVCRVRGNMNSELILGGIYRHYKGKTYKVIDLARHSETLEWLVIYECLYENPKGKIWVRPMGMFMETIILDGKQVPRFAYIGDQKGSQRL